MSREPSFHGKPFDRWFAEEMTAIREEKRRRDASPAPAHRCPVCITDVAELREGVCLDCYASTGRPA